MKKTNKREVLLIIMLLLIMLAILMTSVSFAKYVTQVRGKVFAEIKDQIVEKEKTNIPKT